MSITFKIARYIHTLQMKYSVIPHFKIFRSMEFTNKKQV